MKKNLNQNETIQFQKIIHLCQEGHFEQAKVYLSELYTKHPEHPGILNILGTIEINQGQFESGIDKLKKSLKIDSEQISALNNIGNAYIELKDYEGAIQYFNQAINIDPNFIDAQYNLARAFFAMKQYSDAIKTYEHILIKDPNHYWARNNLGYCFYQLGQYTDALISYEKALQLNQNIAEFHNNKALAELKLDRLDEAIASFNKAIQINPEVKDIYLNLGPALEEAHEIEQAQECYEEALKRDPKNLNIYEYLLGTYRKLEDNLPDPKYINQALEINPKFEPALFAKAEFLIEQGSFKEAQDLLEDLIKNDSVYSASCYAALSKFIKFDSLDHPLIKSMQQKIEDNPDEYSMLNYALGKAYENLKEYDSAFMFYKKANDSEAKKEAYDFKDGLSKIQEYLAFDDEAMQYLSQFSSPNQLPIIIVGMPRSGTTLTEQIISSHPLVKPAGEVSYWGMPTIKEIKETEQDRWLEIVNNYINRLTKISHADKNTARITDKMPHNFSRLGLIASLFPQAKIIHCTRYPLDNCWSIYNQNFNNFHKYKNNLEDLGRYYVAYRKLMEHWESLFPERIMTINYDGLVQDPEYWTRKLIAHVGLTWDEACLNPQKNEKRIKTASVWQSRQPIYKSSVRRSDYFEKNLKPLRDILEAAKIDLS